MTETFYKNKMGRIDLAWPVNRLFSILSLVHSQQMNYRKRLLSGNLVSAEMTFQDLHEVL